MSNWLQKQWLIFTPWHILLLPLSWVFGALVCLRRLLYKTGWLKSYRLDAPVIVVGNITVGGTGKTPLVIWLAEQLKLAGYRPGIVSRGYGGRTMQATEVLANSSPQIVGDEPVLIARRTKCPMFVGADRVAVGKSLLNAHPQCNVIISDDGLQHYRLKRDFEIAIVNSNQQFGNKFLLPAGPLREKVTRLQQVDAIVDSGNADFSLAGSLSMPVFGLEVHGEIFERIDQSEIKQAVSYFADKNLVAIAGIGNPERFFNQLSDFGLKFTRQVFADHYAFSAQDFVRLSDKTILMTEKDAVKCQAITLDDAWYLPITAVVSSSTNASLLASILQRLRV
jgi:tetraacyldisaccharide 4'-kinase